MHVVYVFLACAFRSCNTLCGTVIYVGTWWLKNLRNPKPTQRCASKTDVSVRRTVSKDHHLLPCVSFTATAKKRVPLLNRLTPVVRLTSATRNYWQCFWQWRSGVGLTDEQTALLCTISRSVHITSHESRRHGLDPETRQHKLKTLQIRTLIRLLADV